MKEVVLSTSGLFGSCLRYIDKRLEPFKKSGAVATCLADVDGRSSLAISLKSGAHKVASAIVDAIADIVITDCKFHYIETTLKLPIEDEINRHAFIRALTGLDRATDLALAKSLIKLTPNFLLDSFYTFSLDTLKSRWQEVCALANDNACFLICDGTFRELLRFLISNLESREYEVHLFGRDGGVEVLSRTLKPVNVYVNDELSADAQVVSKLIALAPKRIFLHQDINPVMQEFVCNLFGSCVVINN